MNTLLKYCPDYDMVDYEDAMERRLYISNTTFWKQKNGETIAIKDMTTMHLRNTIRMLKNQIDGSAHDDFCHDYIDAMENELKRRSDNMEKIRNVDLKVVGVTFKNDDGSSRADIIRDIANNVTAGQKITNTMFKNVKVDIIREPQNKFDANAIKVFANGKQIGYIGKDYSAILAPILDAGRTFTCNIKNMGEYKNRPFCEITVDEN